MLMFESVLLNNFDGILKFIDQSGFSQEQKPDNVLTEIEHFR